MLKEEATDAATEQAIENKKLRIVQFNAEWLYVKKEDDNKILLEYPWSIKNYPWKTTEQELLHLNYISNTLKKLNGDIVNLCEVQNKNVVDILVKTIGDKSYTPYIIENDKNDQNVALLTKIKPTYFYKNKDEIEYPIQNSTCEYHPTEQDTYTNLRKNYVAEFFIDGIPIVVIGVHLKARFEPKDCAKKEAQSMIIRKIVLEYLEKNYEIIVLGDFNDFDNKILDINNNISNSSCFDIIKGDDSTYKLYNINKKIPKNERYSEFWDINADTNKTSYEFSMIDAMFVSKKLYNAVKNVFVYRSKKSENTEMDNLYNSDHYPLVVDFDFSDLKKY
jgi:exonuclease III